MGGTHQLECFLVKEVLAGLIKITRYTVLQVTCHLNSN